MQFSFSRPEALKLFRTALRAVPETHAVSALSCFHLLADPDSYELTVTGGSETSRIQTAMPAAVSEGGATAVNAKTFTSAIAAMSGGVVTMKTYTGGISLNDDTTKYDLPVLPADQYPQMKIPDEEQEIRVKGGEFSALCRAAAFAASGHKAEGDALEMLHISVGQGRLSAMAGDGIRVAVSSLPLPDCMQNLNFLLPVSAVSLLVNTLEQDTEYSFSVTPRLTVFRTKNFMAAVTPAYLPYPDFGRVLAAHQSCYEALVNTSELQSSLSLTLVGSPSSAVRLILSKGRLELEPKGNGSLSGTLAIPCQCTRPTSKDGFYYLAGKLLAALKNNGSPSVLLKIAPDGMLRIDGENVSYLQLATIPKKTRGGKSKAA